MRTEDLSQFVAVARAGSIAAAAEQLGVSQPTLSKSLARLERAMRVTLLERHARGVRLTPTGRAVLEHAQRVDLGIRDAFAAARDLRQGVAGFVRVGVGVGIPQALVSAACASALAASRIELEVQGGMSDSLYRAVAAGETDFTVAGVRPPRERGLSWRPLFADPMIAIAHRSHRLAAARTVTWETLAQQTWITANVGTMTRGWFEQQFVERNLPPPAHVVGLRGFPFTYDLGRQLGALMLVPASTARVPRDRGDFVVIRRPGDWRSDRVVGILSRAGGYANPAALTLMASFADAAAQLFAKPAR
ncbi:MAG: LysR family transcriptional regulator [Lautropia sp.]